MDAMERWLSGILQLTTAPTASVVLVVAHRTRGFLLYDKIRVDNRNDMGRNDNRRLDNLCRLGSSPEIVGK